MPSQKGLNPLVSTHCSSIEKKVLAFTICQSVHITMNFDWTNPREVASHLQSFLCVQFLIRLHHTNGYQCCEWWSQGELSDQFPPWVLIRKVDDIQWVLGQRQIQREVLNSSESGWLIYVLKKIWLSRVASNFLSKKVSKAEAFISSQSTSSTLNFPSNKNHEFSSWIFCKMRGTWM